MFPIKPKSESFSAAVSASRDDEEKHGQIKALWMEDEMFPRLFEIISSDHPWIKVGDKIMLI